MSDGNGSSDHFIACTWSTLRSNATEDGQEPGGDRLLVAANYSAHQSQCYVRLPLPGMGSGQWRLQDLLGDARYDRNGDDLQSRGLYLDAAHWQYHAFEMSRLE
jgi:hypothetical protein